MTFQRRRATFEPPPPEALGQVDQLPPVTASTPDVLCWMWAAIPPHDGRLHVARVAEALSVSDSTVRRRIKTDTLTSSELRVLKRRAILRGKGFYLWPPLDQASRERLWLLDQEAHRGLEVLANGNIPRQWNTGTLLSPHTVMVVHYPAAKVYGVSAAATKDTATKIRRAGGEILHQTAADNRFAARVAKAELLEHVQDWRCIPPRSLIPSGRTETWLETGGLPQL